MPRGDGTGPRGMGAGTGRGLGGCTARGSDASKDRGTGFPQSGVNSRLASEDRLTDRGRGIGQIVLDLLYLLFERATRK
jgi:hypothetical protein